MIWTGHIEGMGENRNAYKVWVGKPEGKRSLARSKRRRGCGLYSSC
jgi:hypothetical protein